MTTQDLKNTCIICASDWADFNEQLRAACEARGIIPFENEVCIIFKEACVTILSVDPLEVKVLFKNVDTSRGV